MSITYIISLFLPSFVFLAIFIAAIVLIIVNLKKNKSSGASTGKIAAPEELKNNLANQAFDKLLKRDVDYTVAGEVDGAILVKKEVRWIFCDVTPDGAHGAFTITTDKGKYCFSVEGGKIVLVPEELFTAVFDKLGYADASENSAQDLVDRPPEIVVEEEKHDHVQHDNEDDSSADIEQQIYGKKSRKKKK